MATLEEFLRNGRLGPVVLGMTAPDVITAIGEPQGTSAKSNPLQLKYGSAELSFWKEKKDGRLFLREIVISYRPQFEPFPPILPFLDWNPRPPTKQVFKSFIYYIGYAPVNSVEGPSEGKMTFLSGVTALFTEEILDSLRLHQRRTKETTSTLLSNEREPTTEQILEMLEEAERAANSGAMRAGLLIAWSGLEAVLRRMALSAGKLGKIGVQPAILIRELVASEQLTSDERHTLENFRQLRTSLAHGLAPIPIDRMTVQDIVELSKRLLFRSESNQEIGVG
jgi:hypothetical protein